MAEHLYGPVYGHGFLAWLDTAAGLVAVDTGWDRALPDAALRSAEALAEHSERVGQPLTHILITHNHADHAGNLPALLDRWPGAEVSAHPKGDIAQVTQPLVGGEVLNFGEQQVEVLYTPGHSAALDELSFHLPAHRFLFCGDVAQPQGPSYGYANGPSPVPFFYDGSAYRNSLERLIALDAHYARTGHGDFLGPEQVRQWLRVTLATVTRIEELAIELTERYPQRDAEWFIEAIYDQIVDERHFGLRAANRRKREATYPPDSDFARFDRPGIAWAVHEALKR